MKEYYLEIIESNRKNGLLIDTNLLLLLFVGTFDLPYVEKYKRTAQFAREDFLLLMHIAGQFPKLYTTPLILAEANSLSNQLPENKKEQYYKVFAGQLEILEETYIDSLTISKQKGFYKFGLTDANIVAIANNKILVITADFPLANYLERLKLPVINFNHLRGLLWFAN